MLEERIQKIEKVNLIKIHLNSYVHALTKIFIKIQRQGKKILMKRMANLFMEKQGLKTDWNIARTVIASYQYIHANKT